MEIGELVHTPRFLKVRIGEIFSDYEQARSAGYTEPTHYEDHEYDIKGKHTGENRMVFAAIRLSVVDDFKEAIAEVKKENGDNSLYWKLEYQANTGWKTKYLFGTSLDVAKYINRYIRSEKLYKENLSVAAVKILEKLNGKIDFKVLKN